MSSTAELKRLEAIRGLLTQAHERLALEFGFVLWDGSTVPANLAADALAIAIADEGVVASLIRRPNLDTLVNLWASARVDIRNGTASIWWSGGPRREQRTSCAGRCSIGASRCPPRCASCSCRAVGPGRWRTSSGDRPSSGDPDENKAQYSCPLRHHERVLCALLRSGDELHLRLFPRLERGPCHRAAQQTRVHLPQAAAQARRDGCSTSAAAGVG